jgi:hypothetical protein
MLPAVIAIWQFAADWCAFPMARVTKKFRLLDF